MRRGGTRGREREGGGRERGKEGISYFILLFCSSVVVAAKISPPSIPTYLGSLSRPLPSLSLLHLDLRRKWTFYETEIMALRQSGVRSCSLSLLSSRRGRGSQMKRFAKNANIFCPSLNFSFWSVGMTLPDLEHSRMNKLKPFDVFLREAGLFGIVM